MFGMLKNRNERNFYIIGLVIDILYGVMVFFSFKMFNRENVFEVICVGVAGLLLMFLCMTLNTVVYVLQKDKKDWEKGKNNNGFTDNNF